MLPLGDVLLDLPPLSLPALRHGGVLGTSLTLNFLLELSYQLVDGVLVFTVAQQFNSAAKLDDGLTIVADRNIVFLERALLIFFHLLHEALTLAIQIFLELLSEVRELGGNLLRKVQLGLRDGRIDRVHVGDEASTSLVERLLKGHLDVEKISLQRDNQALQVALVGCVVDSLAGLSKSLTLTVKPAESVLLLFEVCLNLRDRVLFGGALSLMHLLLTESDETLLVSVLVLDVGLERSDELFNCTLGVLPDFVILAEA